MSDDRGPRFVQFEEVVVQKPTLAKPSRVDAALPQDGVVGTIMWSDKPYGSCNATIKDFLYVVFFPSLDRHFTMAEHDLSSTGVIREETEFLGREFEISFDLEMTDANMEYVEGCFRVPGKFWRTFVISQSKISTPTAARGSAQSGMEVLTFLVPLEMPINKALSMSLLGVVVGTQSWKEVVGPDSLVLK